MFLAAFGLYGIGSILTGGATATADLAVYVDENPWRVGIGFLLLAANSVAVVAIGIVLADLLADRRRRIATGYLVGRVAEAILLAAGIGLLATRTAALDNGMDQWIPIATEGATMLYQLAMVALGVASIPLFAALAADRRLPLPVGLWGAIGYAGLAAGALAELAGVGGGIGIALGAAGGVFEVVFGVLLLVRGLPVAAPAGEVRS